MLKKYISHTINSIKNLYNSLEKKYAFNKISRNIKPQSKIKLHIGCGTIYKKNWINIDNNSDNNINKLDLNWDLTKDLPFPNDSVDFIYNEHFIEHLTYLQGQKFLKNIFNLLKNGGVIRIACPDLKQVIEGYYFDNWRKQDWVTTFGFQWIKSRCEMVNICLNKYPWGHQYVYDREDMIRALIEAGFKKTNIKEKKIGKSTFKELVNLESRKDSMIFEITK